MMKSSSKLDEKAFIQLTTNLNFEYWSSIWLIDLLNASESLFSFKCFLNLSPNSKEVEFTSDTIKVDEKNKIVTASGNVVIINDDRKVIADKVIYDQNINKAIASGKVILTE